MDDDWRSLQREWDADPSDQGLLAALIQSRRRAGLPVPESILCQQAFPARTFNAPFESAVSAVPPRMPGQKASCVILGQTPSPVQLDVPVNREWSVDLRPRDDDAFTVAIEHLEKFGVPGLEVRCDSLSNDGLLAIGRLPRLRTLLLRSLDLVTDDGLAFLGSLRDLEGLSLYHGMVGITGRGLQGIGELSRLTTLDLRACPNVDDDAVSWLPRLQALSGFDLSKWIDDPCTITDLTLGHLGGLEYLESVTLEGCARITDGGVARLGSLANLTTLGLARASGLTDRSLDVVLGLQKLESLDINNSPFRDPALERVASLPKLVSLDLERCAFSDSGLRALAGVPLRRLTLGHGDLEGRAFASLPRTLEELSLSSARSVTPEGLHALGGLQSLRRLSLRHVTHLDDAVVETLVRLPNLEQLRLDHAERLTGRSIMALSRAPALRELELSIAPLLSDARFDALARLELLSLDDIELDDQTLARIARMESLRRLSLGVGRRNTARFTFEGLRVLTGLRNLSQVSIIAPGLPDDTEAALRAVLPPTCGVMVFRR